MNSTLLSLNLKGNNISRNGMRAFSDALSSNKILCRILFDKEDLVEQLDSGLKKNFCMTELGCEMPQSTMNFLQRNRKEREVFVKAVEGSELVVKVKAMHIRRGGRSFKREHDQAPRSCGVMQPHGNHFPGRAVHHRRSLR